MFVRGCLLALVVVSGTAMSQDLYGPQAPADAAWLRVINAADLELHASVANSEFLLAFTQAGDYLPVDPGQVRVALNGAEHAVDIAAGQFLSVINTPGDIMIIEDPVLRDISRGLLGLLNLTQHPSLSLLTPGGDTVVEGVEPGAAASLAINAATTELEVHADGEVLGTVPEHAFERGVAYTVAVFDGHAGPVIVLLTAGTG